MESNDKELDRAILQKFFLASEKIRKMESDKYEIDENKADNFDRVLRYCYKLKETHDCEDPVVECPVGQTVSTIYVRFHTFFGLDNKGKDELREILKYADGFTVSDNITVDDWLNVQFSVLGLWKRKEDV